MLRQAAEVRIPRMTLARVVALASAAFPAEACGLLAAKRVGRFLDIVLYPAPNVAIARGSFEIPRAAIATIRRRIGRDGLVLCGCFHSHPSGPARPSPTDSRLARTRPDFLWLIYSASSQQIGVFRKSNGRFTEVPWQYA
ncbi:MAG TPA: M67 family metallopeptidase [Thermoanaerobaculia bacterium]|nr:M67 family metallopeptidase [Thermoanaerobaculia bacterium]